MDYAIGASVSSLQRESTNSLIMIAFMVKNNVYVWCSQTNFRLKKLQEKRLLSCLIGSLVPQLVEQLHLPLFTVKLNFSGNLG